MIELYHNDMSVCAYKTAFDDWPNESYAVLMREKASKPRRASKRFSGWLEPDPVASNQA